MLKVLLGFGNVEVTGDFDKSISGEPWGQVGRLVEAGRLALSVCRIPQS